MERKKGVLCVNKDEKVEVSKPLWTAVYSFFAVIFVEAGPFVADRDDFIFILDGTVDFL